MLLLHNSNIYPPYCNLKLLTLDMVSSKRLNRSERLLCGDPGVQWPKMKYFKIVYMNDFLKVLCHLTYDLLSYNHLYYNHLFYKSLVLHIICPTGRRKFICPTPHLSYTSFVLHLICPTHNLSYT